MTHELTTHEVAYTFVVELERSEDEEDRRYQAYCKGLTGCRVYASSKAEALHKIKQAIGIWLHLADRQFAGEGPDIEDLI